MNLSKLKQIKNFEKVIIEALNHILVMVREKMLVPYHVERFNLMVDTNDLGVIKNLGDFMDQVYLNIVGNFPQTIQKFYLMNVNFMHDVFEKWNRKGIFDG
jgi:L-cystine uptake protein TcyP (sodium:dicarboxylate symporter family)